MGFDRKTRRAGPMKTGPCPVNDRLGNPMRPRGPLTFWRMEKGRDRSIAGCGPMP